MKRIRMRRERGGKGRGGEEGERGGEKRIEKGPYECVCIFFFNCVSSMEKKWRRQGGSQEWRCNLKF